MSHLRFGLPALHKIPSTCRVMDEWRHHRAADQWPGRPEDGESRAKSTVEPRWIRGRIRSPRGPWSCGDGDRACGSDFAAERNLSVVDWRPAAVGGGGGGRGRWQRVGGEMDFSGAVGARVTAERLPTR
jgi:hypothetical protein